MSEKLKSNSPTSKIPQFEPILAQKNAVKPSTNTKKLLSPRPKSDQKKNKQKIKSFSLVYPNLEATPRLTTNFKKPINKEDHIGELTKVKFQTIGPTAEIKATSNKKPFINL